MRIRFEALRATLPDFVLSVDGDFSADALGVFGPSGGGKTTLLEVIAGIRAPQHGRVWLGERLLTASPSRDRRVGYVPQDETLFPHMSVRANVLYGARNGSAPPDLAHLASLIDIEPLLDRPVARLSGGERRRVAIARALMTSPELLLLDEPLAGLDRALKERTLALLQNLRADLRLPLILVSHDRAEVSALCDEVVLLDRGQVVAIGAPAEVL